MPVIEKNSVESFNEDKTEVNNKQNNTTKTKFNLEELDLSEVFSPYTLKIFQEIAERYTCPSCKKFSLQENTTGGLDPQDTITYYVCPECHWTDRPQETPIFDNSINYMEGVPY